jgi:hypothetical protein
LDSALVEKAGPSMQSKVPPLCTETAAFVAPFRVGECNMSHQSFGKEGAGPFFGAIKKLIGHNDIQGTNVFP